MTATLTGVITNIFPRERYGNFHKMVFWVQELNSDPKTVEPLECEVWHDDGIAMLEKFKPSMVVECQIKIIGKKWKDKLFTVLKCNMIKKYA